MAQPAATKTQKVVPQKPVAETPRREVTDEGFVRGRTRFI
jgi:hypothetical protein